MPHAQHLYHKSADDVYSNILLMRATIHQCRNKPLKKDFEKFWDSIGMSMSTAVNIFIKKSVGEQRIPFEITAKSSNTTKE